MTKRKRIVNNILYKAITRIFVSIIIFFTLFTGFLSTLPDFNESGMTYAGRGGFSWRGHEGDNNYREESVDKNTIYRYYRDGCILSYNIDRNGRPVRDSYRWIKTIH